jgi:hypothetical protein
MTALVEAMEKGKAPAWVLGQLLPLTRSNDADTAAAAKALGDKLAEGGWQAAPMQKKTVSRRSRSVSVEY